MKLYIEKLEKDLSSKLSQRLGWQPALQADSAGQWPHPATAV